MNINILGDNCSHSKGTIQGDGWDTLISKLTNFGANLYFNDSSLKTYDLLIAFDHYKWMEEILKNVSVPIKKRILIIQEPEVVLPRMYKTSILNLYGHIYAGSIDWADQLNATPFSYPLDLSSNSQVDFEERSIETALIQTNKFSCVKGENYTLRRRVLSLANKKDFKIELYGSGWNAGKLVEFYYITRYFKSVIKDVNILNLVNPYKEVGQVFPFYMGKTADKIKTLNNVKRNIVIENSSSYISEKLFDSFRSGSVPFYVGPNLEKYGIPDTAVVKCEPSPSDILDKLLSINNDELLTIANQGQEFTKTEDYMYWDAQKSVTHLLSQISDCLN